MVEGFLEVASTSPTSLRVVTICIFQLSMVNDFADAVAKKSSRGFMQMATGSDSLAYDFCFKKLQIDWLIIFISTVTFCVV